MNEENIDPKVFDLLSSLKDLPARDRSAAARGKADFLHQASVLQLSVSAGRESRHKGWIVAISNFIRWKERTPMFKTLMAVLLAAFLFLGGSGIAAYAAQDSLPDQALYSVKLMGEDAQLSLSIRTQTRLKNLLDFTDRRLGEMAGILARGETVPESVEIRLRTQLQQMLELATGSGDAQMLQMMEQIRLRTQIQLQTLDAAMVNAPESTQQLLLRVRDRLQEQLRLCEMAQADPLQFRQQVHTQQQVQLQQGTGFPQSATGQRNGTCTPVRTGESYGPGPSYQQQGTSENQGGAGNSYGPGAISTNTAGDPGQGPQGPLTTPEPGSSGSQPAETPGQQPGPGGGSQPEETPGQQPGPGDPPATPPGAGGGSGKGP
jgi:hypothetical protein